MSHCEGNLVAHLKMLTYLALRYYTNAISVIFTFIPKFWHDIILHLIPNFIIVHKLIEDT